MRTPSADGNSLAQGSEKFRLAQPNDWWNLAQPGERGATGARRMVTLALETLEGAEGQIDCLFQLIHRAAVILARGARFVMLPSSMSGRVGDYEYALPEDLIAQRPLPQREAARMMVLDRAGETIAHRRFLDLPEFVRRDDLLVLNDTRVLPARRFSDDGAIEFLFLAQLDDQTWECLVRPGHKLRLGASTLLDGVPGRVEKIGVEGGRVIRFERALDPYRGGEVPLPPYLGRAPDAEDTVRYQTVFARELGAVAAPTAGLHFTPEILAKLPHTFVTLHVGTGTFRPVQSETIAEHRMHAERFTVTNEAAAAINSAKTILAVGTTSVRVLEAAARKDGRLYAQEGATDIFIYPPYQFRAVDRLLTNFHLPRSTLLMLVAAFAGREFILRAYHEAVRERYRFYSYGDCMLIL